MARPHHPPVPTLDILCNDVGVLASETKITFLFSADVSQFAVNRFAVTGGTVDASTFTRVSGSEYSEIVTPRDNQTGTLTITFGLDVGDSFELSDLAVTNATPNAFTKVSATEYTVQLTPPTGARVLITVTLPAGSVTAVGGSANNRDGSWGKVYLPAT